MKKVSIPKILGFLVFIISAIYLTEFLFVVFSRIQYPFELEWIEGGMLQVVQRILAGEGIYVSPSINFVPFLYPPLYFYLSAGFSQLFGGGFFALRLVSFIASLVSIVAIYGIVFKETNSRQMAFFSASLFTACYRVTGAWLDIARVDSLFLAFTLLAIFFARGKATLWYSFLSGIFSFFAIITKQTALIICIPIFIFLVFQNWKQGAAYIGVVLALLVPTTLVLNSQTNGWYSFYVYEILAQQQEWIPLEFVTFWRDDLSIHLPIAILISLFFLVEEYGKDKKRFFMWLLLLGGVIANSFLSRVKIGGYENVLLPMFAFFCILTGMGISRIVIAVKKSEYQGKIKSLLYAACLVQLVILAYNPFAQIPSAKDLREGNSFVEYLAITEEKVYIPDHGYLLDLAGKSSYAHHAAIWDVLRTDQMTEGKKILSAQLETSIKNQSFDIIIMDEEGNFCCPGIGNYYTKIRDVFDDETSFLPVTGDKRRPTFIFLANRLR